MFTNINGPSGSQKKHHYMRREKSGNNANYFIESFNGGVIVNIVLCAV